MVIQNEKTAGKRKFEMVRGRKIMNNKKGKWIYVLSLMLCILFFSLWKTVAYAYTEEEKEAAKAWLSANGYSPDAAGAAAAYQDYLDGKFGAVPGQENTPPDSSADAPCDPGEKEEQEEEKQETGKDGLGDENKEKTNKDQKKENGQNTGQRQNENNNGQESEQGKETDDSRQKSNREQEPKKTAMDALDTDMKKTTEQEPLRTQALEEMLKQLAESTDTTQQKNNYEKSPENPEAHVSENQIHGEEILTVEKEFHPKKVDKNAFIIWAISCLSIVVVTGIIYFFKNRFK